MTAEEYKEKVESLEEYLSHVIESVSERFAGIMESCLSELEEKEFQYDLRKRIEPNKDEKELLKKARKGGIVYLSIERLADEKEKREIAKLYKKTMKKILKPNEEVDAILQLVYRDLFNEKLCRWIDDEVLYGRHKNAE